VDVHFKEFLNQSLVAEEDDISLFFKSAAEMTRKALFSEMELMELQIEMLSIIKGNRKKKQNKISYIII